MTSDSNHHSDNPETAGVLRRQILLLSIASVVAAFMCLLLWHSTSTLADDLDRRQAHAGQLAADVQAVAALRQRPQEVSETGLLRSDLLDRVNRAMQAARLGPETLVSTLPQPARGRPGSDQAEVVNRLLFENLSLEGLVRFCHTLTNNNPEFHVTAIQLRAGKNRQNWNADISVAYWILVPLPKR